jgi:hypothetical protein
MFNTVLDARGNFDLGITVKDASGKTVYNKDKVIPSEIQYWLDNFLTKGSTVVKNGVDITADYQYYIK